MLDSFIHTTIPNALAGGSLWTIVLVFLGGILTSFSPCILSMLPVMVGYVGGYSAPSKSRGFVLSSFFVLGLAVTFALLGIFAAMMGKIFGQIGPWWNYFLGAFAIGMGLQLLEVIHLRLPGLTGMPVKAKGALGAFLVGLLFGLVASPCATPVLGVIMAYVASQGNLAFGALLLFFYGLGHGLPLLIVGTFTALIKELPKVQTYTKYVNYLSGTVLIGIGLYLFYRAAG